jgi:hypothetical protein
MVTPLSVRYASVLLLRKSMMAPTLEAVETQ